MYWKELHRYAKEIPWTWPRAYKPAYLNGLFKDSKKDASEKANPCKYKGSCSEVLAAMPIITHFAEAVLAGRNQALDLFIDSFGKLHRVIRMLFRCFSVPLEGASTIDDVEAAILAYFIAHVAAYGDDFVKPKLHHATHIAEQARRLAAKLVKDGQAIWMNCLVHERKHQTAKLIMRNIGTAPESFDKAVIQKWLSNAIEELSTPSAFQQGVYLVDAAEVA